MKPIWNRLKDMKCPRCANRIEPRGASYVCTKDCGFVVRKDRFDEIIKSLYNPVKREIEY